MIEAEKFWARVNRTDDGCWEWSGSRTTGGYGNLRLPSGKYAYAHRVAYELEHGPIPSGLHLDHLCRNRACARPAHLEAVTPAENVRRGAAPYGPIRTTCKHGHDITRPEHVYTTPSGARRCRVCARQINDARRAARHARGDLRKVLRPECSNGHRYDESNTQITPAGNRRCRACSRAAATRQREKRKHDSV